MRRTPRPARKYDEASDGAAAVWAFLWTLFAFKMATVVLIFWYDRSWASGLVLSATTWYWLPLLAVLVAAPLVYHYRVRKVRARRHELIRSEWMVDAAPGEPSGPVPHRGSPGYNPPTGGRG